MIAQALSDDKDDLIFVIVKAAIEKTRSDGAFSKSCTNFDAKKELLFGNRNGNGNNVKCTIYGYDIPYTVYGMRYEG